MGVAVVVVGEERKGEGDNCLTCFVCSELKKGKLTIPSLGVDWQHLKSLSLGTPPSAAPTSPIA